MSLVEIFVLAVFVPLGLWFLYNIFTVAEEGKKIQYEAPYKIEPNETLDKSDFSPHVVAVQDNFNKEFPRKRTYKKKNKKYWAAKTKSRLPKKTRHKVS